MDNSKGIDANEANTIPMLHVECCHMKMVYLKSYLFVFHNLCIKNLVNYHNMLTNNNKENQSSHPIIHRNPTP